MKGKLIGRVRQVIFFVLISIVTSSCGDYLPFCLLSKDCGQFPSYYITDPQTVNNGYKISFEDSIQLKIKVFLFHTPYSKYPVVRIKLTVFNKYSQNIKFFHKRLKLTSNLIEYGVPSIEGFESGLPILVSPGKKKKLTIVANGVVTEMSYKEFREHFMNEELILLNLIFENMGESIELSKIKFCPIIKCKKRNLN